MVDEGYIIYLDDDDALASNDVIEKLVPYLNNDKIVLFNSDFGNRTLPTPEAISKLTNSNPSDIGSIGGICFAFPYYKFKKEYNIEWDEFTCSDNRLINSLAGWEFNKVIHVPILVTKLQGKAGGGNKKDKAL